MRHHRAGHAMDELETRASRAAMTIVTVRQLSGSINSSASAAYATLQFGVSKSKQEEPPELLSHPNRPDLGPPLIVHNPIGRQNLTVSRAALRSTTGPANSSTWRDYVHVFEGPSAYSSLAAVDAQGKTCAVLYERSAIGKLPVQFDTVNIATFPCEPS